MSKKISKIIFLACCLVNLVSCNNNSRNQLDTIKVDTLVEQPKQLVSKLEVSKCSDMNSYNYGYSIAADQIGHGLMADCEYLFEIAQTQKENLNHYCFCKGVNDWINEHKN